MFYFIYVLFSLNDKGIYIGFTDDLNRRVKEHQKGFVKSTKDRRPIKLIYFEGYKDKKSAVNREKYLKSGWGRNYLNKMVINYIKNSPKI